MLYLVEIVLSNSSLTALLTSALCLSVEIFNNFAAFSKLDFFSSVRIPPALEASNNTVYAWHSKQK